MHYFRPVSVMKPKDDAMIPHRVYAALMAAGWYGRMDVCWAKGNPMPESVTDRPTRAHEYIFLLAKSERYYYDHIAVQEKASASSGGWQSRAKKGILTHGNGETAQGASVGGPTGTRNRRSVWTVNPKGFPGAHFAVFPAKLIEPCILAGTSEKGACPACGAPYERVVERTPMEIRRSDRGEALGEYGRTAASGTMVAPAKSHTTGWQPTCTCDAGDPIPCTVLDPFSGAGTTGLVALAHNRNYIGIELNPEYVAMSEKRIRDAAPLFNVVETIPA